MSIEELANETDLAATLLVDELANNVDGNGDLITVIDCTAIWCGPCKRMLPILEDLSSDEEFAPRIFKIDVDKNRGWANEQGVKGVPNFIIFRNGQRAGSFSGARGKSDFVAEVNKVLDDA